MDPFSQAGLGAVVAQAAGHRQLGVKAAVYGALAGALPDIDVLFSIGGDFVDQLITHRGITHSLFFAPVVGPLLGWLIWRRLRRKDPEVPLEHRNRWMLVITLALLSHPLLDVLTPYGTQLLLPFSNTRFAINAMPIIDPVYTLILGIGLLLAWWSGRWDTGAAAAWLRPGRLALATLVLSTSYLGYGWLQNLRAESAATSQLAAHGVHPIRLAAFPTMLQVHLRRVVARLPRTDLVGFYSTWTPCEITWWPTPRAPAAELGPFLATREGRVFDWFTMGWANYSIKQDPGGKVLVANDLRYGFGRNPLVSIFSLSAILGSDFAPLTPPSAGRNVDAAAGSILADLIEQTYAPACRLLGIDPLPTVPTPVHPEPADAQPPEIPHNAVTPNA